MAFGDIAKAFARGLFHKQQTSADRVLELSLNSVKYGSELTESPGQPVGPEREHEHLVDSIQIVSRGRGVKSIEPVGEAKAWAKQNEDGIARPGGGEYRLLSPVGGRWSFARTRSGAHNIVAAVREGNKRR